MSKWEISPLHDFNKHTNLLKRLNSMHLEAGTAPPKDRNVYGLWGTFFSSLEAINKIQQGTRRNEI